VTRYDKLSRKIMLGSRVKILHLSYDDGTLCSGWSDYYDKTGIVENILNSEFPYVVLLDNPNNHKRISVKEREIELI
jgi:hypothetical protein